MKHMRLLAFAVLSFIVINHSRAQTSTQIPFINSSELIEKGIKENDQGNFKKALSYYDQVPEGDSNYVFSLYEKSLSHLNDSSYDKCIEFAKKAIALKSPEKRMLLLNMAAAFDYKGKPEEALKLYDSVAKLYPFDNHPYYERAIIKYKAKDYTAAEKLLEQSLMLNPQHFRSHFLLGSTYAYQGRLTEAMMALSTSLLCTADYEVAKNPIAILDAIAIQADEIVKEYDNRNTDNRDPAFDEIDDIIHAKLALDKGYKLKTELDDEIFRQLQVIMEKLVYDKADPSFAMQYYVPLYSKIYQDNQFEPFVLQLFSNYGFKSIDKLSDSRKNKAALEEIRNIIYPYLNRIFETRELNYVTRQKAPAKYHQYSKDNSIIDGVFSNEQEEKLAAGRVNFYTYLRLSAEGNYDADGKKDGLWKYYYPNGNIRLKQETKSGKLINADTSWYTNGVVKNSAKYNTDGDALFTQHYDYTGILEYTSKWMAKDDYEYTYYYPSGTVRKTQRFVKDKIVDCKYMVYYESGKIQREVNCKNGAFNGPIISYFENGKIDDSATNVNDKTSGQYKSYYRNGNLEIECTYVEGKKEGACIDYWNNGNLYSKTNYKNGKLDGEAFYYNKAGKQFGTVTYKNGGTIRSRFYRPDGTEIKDDIEEGYVNIYNEYGVLIRKSEVDRDGIQQGVSKYYFTWGGLKEKTNFENGKPNGASTLYYQNGNIRSKRQYTNDTSDGYFQFMYEYGKLKSEGWIKNDLHQGIWHNYFPNGNTSFDYYLQNDLSNGPEKNYQYDSKLKYTKYYDKDMIIGFTQFDTTGKIVQQQSFDKGNGKYRLLHLNGAPGLECDLKNGKLNGPYTIHGGNKTLVEKGAYSNGRLNGEIEVYFPNGKLKSKGLYKNGEQDKTWIYYGINGSVESISQYYKGDLDGLDSTFLNGALISVTKYRNGEADGEDILYGENGKIAAVVYYDYGTAIGYSYEDKEGKLLPVKPIINGAAHIQTYYANGNKGVDWNMEKNLFQGKQLSYYSNGQLKQESNYDNGMRSGTFNQFNTDGSKLYEANYKDGEKQGISKTYNNKGKQIFVVNFTNGQMNGAATYTDAQGKNQNFWYYYGSLEQ